jgi:hypothetical protein
VRTWRTGSEGSLLTATRQTLVRLRETVAALAIGGE